MSAEYHFYCNFKISATALQKLFDRYPAIKGVMPEVYPNGDLIFSIPTSTYRIQDIHKQAKVDFLSIPGVTRVHILPRLNSEAK